MAAAESGSSPIGRAEPWRCRPDWASGRARGSGVEDALLVIWGGALAWLALCAGAVATLCSSAQFGRQDDAGVRTMLGLGAPIVAVVAVRHALAATRRRRRYGRSWLTFDAVPAVPGGLLSGHVDCAVSAGAQASFQLELLCHASSEFSSGPRAPHTRLLWRAEASAQGEPSPTLRGGTRVPIRFALPADARTYSAAAGVGWSLTVHTWHENADYLECFDIPVFPGTGGAATDERIPPPRAAAQPPPDPRGAPAGEDRAPLRIAVPPALHPATGILLLAILATAIWLSAIHARSDGPHWALAGALAAVLFVSVAHASLVCTVLSVQPAEILVQRSMLGVAWSARYATNHLSVEPAGGFHPGWRSAARLVVRSGDRTTEIARLVGDYAAVDQMRRAIQSKLLG